MNNFYLILYLASVVYATIRFKKWDSSTSIDGVVGTTPGLIFIATLALAPILVIIDTTIIVYRKIKNLHY